MTTHPIITESLKAEAQAMLGDGRDYFPGLRNGVFYGPTHGLYGNYMLYRFSDNYGDSVWLVDTLDSCVMSDAVKIVQVV